MTNLNKPDFPVTGVVLDVQGRVIQAESKPGLSKREYFAVHYICDAADKDAYLTQWHKMYGEDNPTPQELQVFIADQLLAEL